MLARTFLLLLACVLTFPMGATVALCAAPQEDESKAELEKQLQRLLHERVATAERGKDAVQAAFEAETVTLDVLVEATNKLLDARLAIAATPAEEIDALEKRLESMQEIEQKIKVLYQFGIRGGEAKEYATMQRERQTAQIALIRARLKAMR